MRKTGENGLRRMLALLLTLTLMMSGLPAAARALEGWENLAVGVIWVDAEGHLYRTPAVRIPQETGITNGWWAVLPEEALGTDVRLDIMNTADPLSYTYWVNDMTLQLHWPHDKNAMQDLGDYYANYIGYSYQDVPQVSQINDLMKLYLSTEFPPFEVPEDVMLGGSVQVMGGVEIFTPAVDGAELIGPETGGAELIGPVTGGMAAVTQPPVQSVPRAVITVYYRTVDGQTLDMKEVTLQEGQNELWPESSKVAGYNLTGIYPAEVYVYNGYPDVPSVTFTYEAAYVAPVEAVIDVYYYHQTRGELEHQRRTLQVGRNVIYPDNSIASGYEPIYAEPVEIIVDANGQPDLASVSFYYRDYPDAADNDFGYVQQPEDSFVSIITPQPVVTSEPPVSVIVPASRASFTLKLRDYRGNVIPGIQDMTISLENGTHVLDVETIGIPAGYVLHSLSSDQVTVRVSNGRANPETHTFVVEKQTIPTYDVTVYYYDSSNNEIAPRQTLKLQPGVHTISEREEGAPAGYTLQSDRSFLLTVYDNGAYDRAAEDVGFWYGPVQTAARSGRVSVQYVDQYGRILSGPHSYELPGGQTHSIAPQAAFVPAGYEMKDAAPQTVTVSHDGVATPATVLFTLSLQTDPVTPPAGQEIGRYGIINAKSVALRTEPSTRGGDTTVITRLQPGDTVYMRLSDFNDRGELWTMVVADGREGYVKTSFLNLLTHTASSVYAQTVGATPVPALTPVPTATPAPTPTPTEAFVEYITPTPATPAPYTGPALVTGVTELKAGLTSYDRTIRVLQLNEVVTIFSTRQDLYTGLNWCFVQTHAGDQGYVLESMLEHITDAEAKWYISLWQQQNATPVPTVLVTNTPMPEQRTGYARAVQSGVPLKRTASHYSGTISELPYGEVVKVDGQLYVSNAAWHIVSWKNYYGYISSEYLWMMSEEETAHYLDSIRPTATPSPVITSRPASEYPYGRVKVSSGSTVNFRSTPSTLENNLIGTIRNNTVCRISGTTKIGNDTWYEVAHEGRTGYIHGKYFQPMTWQEYYDFQQQQGSNGNTGGSGYTDQTIPNGSISSDGSVTIFPEYISPVTPVPDISNIGNSGDTSVPTLEPMVGLITPSPTQTHNYAGGGNSNAGDATGTGRPEVSYGSDESDGGSNWLLWVLVIAMITVAGGGVFIFVQNQRRRRKIAMRAAQRRAQEARASAERPVPRSAQSRTGMYPQQPGTQRGYQSGYPAMNRNGYEQRFNQPTQPKQTPVQNFRAYSMTPEEVERAMNTAVDSEQIPVVERPHARQADSNDGSRRVGRRTAYRNSVTEQQKNNRE